MSTTRIRPHKRAGATAPLLALMFIVLAVLGAIHWNGVADQASTYRALQEHGVIAEATVINSSYDASGGDPHGWTSDTVTFRSSGDTTVRLGHHGGNRVELRTGKLRVIYDRNDPARVMALQAYRESAPTGDVVITAFITVISGALALALLTVTLGVRIRSRHGVT